MRITQEQINQILDAISKYASIESVNVFLYGSRVDDSLKGGDIDLLIIAEPKLSRFLQEKKFAILNEIKKTKSIGERRVDLKVATQEELKTDPFLKQVSGLMVKLDTNK